MVFKETNSSVTLQEIASHCGVTKGTVSRALRGDLAHVGPETIKRIKTAARELGYNPGSNHDARRLALRKGNRPIINNTIGLLLPRKYGYDCNYYMILFNSILEMLMPKHFGLLVAHICHDTRAEDLPYAFRRDEIDGFIACDENFHPYIMGEMIKSYSSVKRPAVSMIYRIPGCSSVVPDHQMAGYLLARHLLSLGHRHIMHFIPSNTPPYHPHALRLAGYRQAYYEIHLNPDSYLQCGLLENDAYSDVANTVRTLIRRSEITAVLAPYDNYAVRLIGLLAQCGKRVPEDISIVGMDDTDPAQNERGENILTTVQMPLREIGRQATELMLHKVLEKESEDVTIMLPVELMERASTCPPRQLKG
jgi:LacI family transcriptional regulator